MGSRTSFRARAQGTEGESQSAPDRQKHIRRTFASKKRGRSNGGVVLVVLLMSMAVLTMLVVHMQVSARTALAAESRLLLHARLQAAAEDAAWRALSVLAADDNLLVDHTNEPWAAPAELRLPDGILVRSVMEDENRRLDLNALSVASAYAGARSPESFVADVLRHTGFRDAENAALALARAILRDPAVLVLDEATSAVDNETEAAIQRSLAEVSQGRTTIMVAHRLSTVRHADRIWVLEAGRVVEAGTHDELVSRPGPYADLWAVQTGVLADEVG